MSKNIENFKKTWKNPILLLLSRGRRYLKSEYVAAVIAAVANMPSDPFMLKDLDAFLPEEIRNKKAFRRSISGLLDTLVEIGYLSKPTPRKYLKLYPTLSHYLSASLFKLTELERRIEPKIQKGEKIIKFSNDREDKSK